MLQAQLHHPNAIKSYLQQHRNQLRAMLDDTASSGLALAARHAKIADGLLSSLFAGAAASTLQRTSPPLLLAAVGGYGRNQLGWKSDLDVLFVTEAPTAQLATFVEAVLYPLWDAGVAIGHQVMCVDDVIENARSALPTATALLDWRPLAGDLAIAGRLRERAFAELFSGEQLNGFLGRLQLEVEERWRRFGDSVYLLEPDVKNGAGGLRDVDVTSWAARARFRGAGWSELVDAGVLTQNEACALQDATEFFFRVRNQLHQRAGRRNDRLTFDQQETLALNFGYRNSVPAPPPGSDAEHEFIGPIVEEFMSDYYRHARAVARAQEQVLARAMRVSSPTPDATRSLSRGLWWSDGALGFAYPERVVDDPAIVLRLYVAAVKRKEPVMPSARDLITRLTSEDPQFCAALRASPDAARLFAKLLCATADAPFRNGSVLSELHSVGLLVAMIPEFAPVVGRVHHDLYHVYTVDVHSVAAVDRVRALVRGELMQRHALACRLAAEQHQPEVLFFATLLHDIGKVFGGKEHSERGAEMARSILARFAFDPEQIELVCTLIKHHLTMYFVAARRDLADPVTIRQFAEQVGDRHCLRSLYLLTIADISTTAPTSMTSWKSRMLDELYTLTDERLAGTVQCDPLRRAQFEARAHAGKSSGQIDAAFFEEFLSSMPERYVLSNAPAEIVAHARVVHEAGSKSLHLQLVPSRHAGVAELCVVISGSSDPRAYGPDRPGLLAAMASALTACRLEIHAAQIYTRTLSDGSEQVLDVFWVRDRVHGLAGVEPALPKFEQCLSELISGKVTAAQLLQQRVPTRWSDRPCPPVLTEVAIDNRSSSRYTIIEVITQDRPGVLFRLAHALHLLGLTIAFAKVNTEGNRVVDIFYVTELDETKVATRARIDQIKQQLTAAVLNQATGATAHA